MRRALPIAFAFFAASVLSYGVSMIEHTSRSSGMTPPTASSAAPVITPEEDRLAVIDREIAFHRARGLADPNAWLDWDFVANGYMQRARLSGDYQDWRRAEEALAAAFPAGRGYGPFLTRATFNAAMHRIDRVDADLDAAEHAALVTPSDYDAILAMRADTRFYQGRYVEALEIYDGQILRTHRSVDALVMLAQLDWHTGHFEEATDLLDEAAASPRIQDAHGATLRAWVLMTRATMEQARGRYDAAREAIATAKALNPDDAHIDEVEAQIREETGDEEGALA